MNVKLRNSRNLHWRLASLALLGACASALLHACPSAHQLSTADLREGDIIFQTSRSGQSRAIQIATHSKYSHMGLLTSDGADWCVCEAVGPVKCTKLQKWIDRGEGSRYVLKRLRNAEAAKDRAATLKRVEQAYFGIPYDQYFGWSDDKIYCSELVWKVYKSALGIELCKLRKLKDFDLSSPVVVQKLKQRYGAKLPLQENVVSPSDIFDSPLLETVGEG